MLSRRKGLFIVTTMALVGVASVVRIGQAQKATSAKASSSGHAQLASNVAVVGRAVGFAETRPVRELMAKVDQVDLELQQEAEEINELNAVFHRKPNPHSPAQKDGALQSSFGPDGRFKLNIPAPILVFEGVGVTNSAPPDTEGAVGPNDYVQIVNGGGVQIFDKNGVARGPAFKLSTLFAPLGASPRATIMETGSFSTIEWRIAGSLLSLLLPALPRRPTTSRSPFPRPAIRPVPIGLMISSLRGMIFPITVRSAPGRTVTTLPIVSLRMALTYNGFGCFAFDRAKMLVGDPTATFIYFNAGPSLSNSSSGIIPSDYNGLTPPPAGAPNVFSVYLDDAFDTVDALRLFDFHADFAVPANSTFLERPESPLPVASFDSRSPGTLTGQRNEIEEPPPAVTADYLNAIGDRLMLRLQYFNRAGTETLTTVQTVNGRHHPSPWLGPHDRGISRGDALVCVGKDQPGRELVGPGSGNLFA